MQIIIQIMFYNKYDIQNKLSNENVIYKPLHKIIVMV